MRSTRSWKRRSLSADRSLLDRRLLLLGLLGLLLLLLVGDESQAYEDERAPDQPGDAVAPRVDPHEQGELVFEEREHGGTYAEEDEICT